MTAMRSFTTALKDFQRNAVNNATTLLAGCLVAIDKVRKSPTFINDRQRIVNDQGAILFEAPTGTGKTLMIGHVVEAVSKKHHVIWLWFAPFAGLIDQATKTIHTEFPVLRPRNPTLDRDTQNMKTGDVFVTTWASVAVLNADSRKVRSETETMPSLDDFIAFARSKEFAIGVVIDEAHHSFRGQSQAFAFYKDVLKPELTILASATPRDADIDKFCQACGIKDLRRTSISRQQGVDAGLIKQGVKVAVFKVPADVSKLIDFQKTALKQGVAVHRKLKELLKPYSVTPMLLVQVDSEDGSVAAAQTMLKGCGFKDEQVRTHTSDEPDPFLMTIAADENVEVLIFKMAVATGFDVPRAFTLVSFRSARDPDFGVQLVGRILRVDRRLQGVDALPAALNYGYVFLSDNTAQTGLSSAANRINAIQNELASVTSNVAVAMIGDQAPTALTVTKTGQIPLLPHETEATADEAATEIAATEPEATPIQQELMAGWQLDFTPAAPTEDAPATQPGQNKKGLYEYPLRPNTGAPSHFMRAVVSLDQEALHQDIVARFEFTDELLLKAQRTAVDILMEEIEIFGNLKDAPETIRADLAQREVDEMAQKVLFKADDLGVIDVRELNDSLLTAFRRALEAHGVEAFDTDEKLLSGLNKILALRPGHLKNAISEAVALHTVADAAAPIPKSITSINPLKPARLNVYGVFPDDLNTWEISFAEYLDNDTTETVKWWHRNPPRKPYSVGLPLPGQPDFYPDFIVGVKDRKRGDGILLAETKRVINDEEGNAAEKAQAEHPTYKRVMMLYWENQQKWMTVEYDGKTDKNILDRVLRPELMVGY